MLPSSAARLAIVTLAAVLAAGCGSGAGTSPSGAPSSSPGGSLSPSPATSSSPVATGSPEATLDGQPFPTGQAVLVPPGRYASQPPFAVPFTFEVSGAEWRTWHHLPEFLDIAKYDPSVQVFQPSRWLAFGRPEVAYGPDGEEVATADPAAAADAWASREDLVTSQPEPFELDGLAGLRLDIHTSASTTLFGGARGDLGLQPELDVRVGIVAFAEGLLLVLSFAPPEELDAAWTEAVPIVASVTLAGR